jgi:cysteine desulfurase
MKDRIYLDYNATAPLRFPALEAMNAVMAAPHNASSVHSFGREARKLIEDARVKVAALVNAPPAQVIFNSGATEGNNTVLKYFSNERILVSATEHPSVLEAAPHAEKIPVTEDGVINLLALEQLLSEKKPALVSIMWANNETGVIQPVQQISELVKRNGALFHCDATQAAGRVPVDITGIDFLTLSSHKLGGPQGVGALVLGLCGITPTLIDGGGQEKKARAGTENVAGIAGFGVAAAAAAMELPKRDIFTRMRDLLEFELLKINKNIVIHSRDVKRLPNTLLFSVPGTNSETLLMAFDLEGIALSNGSACTSGSVKASHVLKAMNVPDDLAAGTLRVSLGWNTKESDIEKFLKAFDKINARLKK